MNKRQPISKQVRYDTLRRCFFSCFWCGLQSPIAVLEIDHLIPVSRGGDNRETNLVAACSDCNGGRSNSDPRPVDIARAKDLWCSYQEGRGLRLGACDLCGMPVDHEDENTGQYLSAPVDTEDDGFKFEPAWYCDRCGDRLHLQYRWGLADGTLKGWMEQRITDDCRHDWERVGLFCGVPAEICVHCLSVKRYEVLL